MNRDKKFLTASSLDIFLILMALGLVAGVFIQAFLGVYHYYALSLAPPMGGVSAPKVNAPNTTLELPKRLSVVPVLPASGPADAGMFTEVISRAARSTCKIATGSSTGTGFIIYSGQNAVWIMTCEHVVSNVTKKDIVKAVFGGGGEIPYSTYDCRLMSKNKEQDTALLVASKKPSEIMLPLPIRADKPVFVGEPIMAFGCPLGIPNVCTFGRVATLARPNSPGELQFVADMSGVPGMSGSPVLDSEGYVVGMVEAVLFNRTAYSVGPLALPEMYPLAFITDATVLSRFLNQCIVVNKAPQAFPAGPPLTPVTPSVPSRSQSPHAEPPSRDGNVIRQYPRNAPSTSLDPSVNNGVHDVQDNKTPIPFRSQSETNMAPLGDAPISR